MLDTPRRSKSRPPDPDEALPPGADEPDDRGDREPVAANIPVGIRSAALSVIAAVALILTLRYAQEVFIPIVLSGLLFYALDPLVDWLEDRRVHRAVASALVLLTVVGAAGAGVYSLRWQAMTVVERLPAAARNLRQTLLTNRRQSPGAIEKVQKAASEIQKTAAAATPETEAPVGVSKVQIEEPPFRIGDYVWWGSWGILGLAGDLVMIMFLTYFLLVSDDLYKRKLVKLSPSLSKKKLTVQILDQIGHRIERFLLVQVWTSALVGVVTGLALWMIGLEQAALWGLMAGIFNSIPYFGPVIVTAGLATVAFLQFGTLSMALYTSGIALMITTLEGWLLTPSLMGKAAQMSPVAVFIGLIFWSWMWGVWGLLLAVPMLMATKAVCDYIEELQWIGELLGE